MLMSTIYCTQWRKQNFAKGGEETKLDNGKVW